ncbi:MAG: hypothetical protein NUV63_13705 [Gallionella sp.]|nr:hypothetical protein [Gallionella sp.]
MNRKKLIFWATKVILPAVGAAITVWTVFFLGDNRELSYEIVSRTELSALKGENWPDIGLWYGKKVIENGGLLTVRLGNTGNVPLYANEFDGPITIQLKAPSRFIAAKAIEVKPKNLVPKIGMSTNVLKIDPMLLNPSDEMLIQTIVQGELSSIEISARIGGVSEATDLKGIRDKTFKKISWILLAYGFLSFVGYSLIGPVILRSKTDSKQHDLSRSGAILLVALVLLPGVWALVYFSEVQGMEMGWNLFFYLFGLIVLAEIFAILFRPAEQKTETKREGI